MFEGDAQLFSQGVHNFISCLYLVEGRRNNENVIDVDDNYDAVQGCGF